MIGAPDVSKIREIFRGRLQTVLGIQLLSAELREVRRRLDIQAMLLGRIAISHLADPSLGRRLADWEFRVYSQWGEDGIIQSLIQKVSISRPIFVEFGVESYYEANTRFLLVNNNWSGLVIDDSESHIDTIRRSEMYWRYNLKAERAFVTRENINDLLKTAGVTGDIGLLSIDIDGNDYWVWQAIDVIRPDIVVIEYNARFGPTASITVPYDAAFERARAHYSMIYYGASLAALARLGNQKGLALVGCNSAGNNAFFVRREKLPSDLRSLQPEEAFVVGKFRESRNERGEPTFLTRDEEQAVLRRLPVVEV
jgi:hypothetical protein